MDQDTLVEGGDAGLRRIASAFQHSGFPVQAIYLTRRQNIVDDPSWNIVLIVSPFRPGTDVDAIIEHVALKRAKVLPFIDDGVRLEAVAPSHPEASRILRRARDRGGAPGILRDASIDGLFVEYALVADDVGERAEAA